MILGLLMLAGGVAAGVFGSLLGLGGGILIVPLGYLRRGDRPMAVVSVLILAVIGLSVVAASWSGA